MRRIGIDYGERKTGLAWSEGSVAEPLMVIRHGSLVELIGKIKKVAVDRGAEEMVVGVSEGEMGERQKAFGLSLAIGTGLPVEFEDETLTTRDAQKMSIEAGIGRKKRRRLEDAYAAAVMLQGWVDRRGL